MRYWVNGEDEGYERESERVLRFGGVPPAPVSPSEVVGMVLLVGIQALLFISAIAFLISIDAKHALSRKAIPPTSLITFSFAHEDGKGDGRGKCLLVPGELRADGRAAAALARASSSAVGFASHAQGERGHSQLEPAATHHRPPKRPLFRTNAHVPQRCV